MKTPTPPEEIVYDVYWQVAGPIESPSLELTRYHVIYMLLGHHSIYGSRKLLYVGRTRRIDRRLTEHKQWSEYEADAIEARVATIGRFKTWSVRERDARDYYDDETSNDLVAHVEALLVYAHQPAYNSHLLRSAPQQPPSGPIRVFNTGRFAPLLPEVSTRRYRDLPTLKDE